MTSGQTRITPYGHQIALKNMCSDEGKLPISSEPFSLFVNNMFSGEIGLRKWIIRLWWFHVLNFEDKDNKGKTLTIKKHFWLL
jgi:hypothetical protein